ncbi:hypothetical protein [Actinomadura rugatobispora]|uniref:non-specific serine/threonine protein kinase n=1 Tax=Actinomadura rugatobispora TaxID=1994 RepID=A0ABW1AHJ4_9ACTN|nr:hypothetical protein GCM10010200_109660 [Actinomadura rugatobispora]
MEPGLRLTERYRLVERLDGGGTGHVWRAWDEALNRPVAVRIPGFARVGGGSGRPGPPHARVVDRVVNAVRITHPAFVTVYDCDRTRDGDGRQVSYIVTAFLDGETLAERIARGTPPVPEALECCAQVAAALAAAHAAGVAHGDLRPEKVFLTPDGVRIVGLGMASHGAPARGGGAAPEAGQAADVLALGDLLGACLPEPPAEDSAGGSAEGSAEDAAEGSAPETPEEVVRLGALCRSPDPAARPAAARAAEILAGALGREPGADGEPVLPASPGGPGPSDATAVLDRPEDLESRQADAPERPSRSRSPALDGDRAAVFRVAVAVTLAAASLAAILVVAGRGSLPGPSPGQGGSAPPLPAPASPRGAEPTETAPPGPTPDPAPEVFATLGRLQPIVDRGQASGAIRSDVAVDLNNLITNLRNDLASGRTGDAPLKLAQLREKIETRLRERALDDEVAARMTDVLSNTAAP